MDGNGNITGEGWAVLIKAVEKSNVKAIGTVFREGRLDLSSKKITDCGAQAIASVLPRGAVLR